MGSRTIKRRPKLATLKAYTGSYLALKTNMPISSLQALATKALVSNPEALQAMRTDERLPAHLHLEVMGQEFMALPPTAQHTFFVEHTEFWLSPEALAGLIFRGPFKAPICLAIERIPDWADMTPLFAATCDYSTWPRYRGNNASASVRDITLDCKYFALLFQLACRLGPEEWIRSLTQEHVAQPLMQKFLAKHDRFTAESLLRWLEEAETHGRDDIVALLEPMRAKWTQRVQWKKQSSSRRRVTRPVMKALPRGKMVIEQDASRVIHTYGIEPMRRTAKRLKRKRDEEEYQRCRRDLWFSARWSKFDRR